MKSPYVASPVLSRAGCFVHVCMAALLCLIGTEMSKTPQWTAFAVRNWDPHWGVLLHGECTVQSFWNIHPTFTLLNGPH